MTTPRFNWETDRLPGCDEDGRCLCGGEYDPALLAETGHQLCMECGAYTETLGPTNPSIADQVGTLLHSLDRAQTERDAKRIAISLYILSCVVTCTVGIYAIYRWDVSVWLVWFCAAVQPALSVIPVRRLARIVARRNARRRAMRNSFEESL